jgi:hypothetical protein
MRPWVAVGHSLGTKIVSIMVSGFWLAKEFDVIGRRNSKDI